MLSYFQSEDWLIVITTDHGGIETWHGGQTLEERSTWIVCNKPIDEKYMGSGYDGYTEKQTGAQSDGYRTGTNFRARVCYMKNGQSASKGGGSKSLFSSRQESA